MKKLNVLTLIAVMVVTIFAFGAIASATEYKYDKGPTFIAEYDDEMESSEPNEAAQKTGMVFFAMKPGWVEGFMVNVRDAEGIDLKTIADKHVEELKEAKATDVSIVSTEAAETEDGTVAQKTVIEYVASSGSDVTQVYMDTIKDGKWVLVWGWSIMDPEDVLDQVSSIEFQ